MDNTEATSMFYWGAVETFEAHKFYVLEDGNLNFRNMSVPVRIFKVVAGGDIVHTCSNTRKNMRETGWSLSTAGVESWGESGIVREDLSEPTAGLPAVPPGASLGSYVGIW